MKLIEVSFMMFVNSLCNSFDIISDYWATWTSNPRDFRILMTEACFQSVYLTFEDFCRHTNIFVLNHAKMYSKLKEKFQKNQFSGFPLPPVRQEIQPAFV